MSPPTIAPKSAASSQSRSVAVSVADSPGRVLANEEEVDDPDQPERLEPLELGQDLALEVVPVEDDREDLDGPDLAHRSRWHLVRDGFHRVMTLRPPALPRFILWG